MAEQNLVLTCTGNKSYVYTITDVISQQDVRSVICLCVHVCVD